MKRLVRKEGEGGGHRTKAGGFVKSSCPGASETPRPTSARRRRECDIA
jgi:hypothetical protein